MRLLRKINSKRGQEDHSPGEVKQPNRGRKIVLAIACFAITVPLVWSVSPLASSSHASGRKARPLFSPKLQAGVGSEVVFDSNKPPLDRARDRVESIDTFIAKRSGLRMDQQTKARLTQLEASTIEGATKPISIKKYVDALTEAVVARATSLSDHDLDYAAATFKRNGGMSLRADGKFGMTEAQFFEQARGLRSMAAGDTSGAIAVVGAALNDEIGNRIADLRDGVPNQFAAVESRGLTPAQAVLVTYSVLADDELSLSSGDLNKFAGEVASHRQALQSAGARQAAAALPNPATVKAYGPEGRLFAAPVDLVFNQATLNNLMDNLSRGGN